jgi:hypothetical protein
MLVRVKAPARLPKQTPGTVMLERMGQARVFLSVEFPELGNQMIRPFLAHGLPANKYAKAKTPTAIIRPHVTWIMPQVTSQLPAGISDTALSPACQLG